MGCIFSVIIPVYNTERYLRECLDSVLLQSVKDIQVICINDGSTDGSLSILEEYYARDKRIVIFSQENRGQAMARNVGIQKAEGEFLLFLDSDDMFRPNVLAEILGQLRQNDVELFLYDADCMYETEKLSKADRKDAYYHRKKSYGGPKNGQVMFAEQMEGSELCDSASLMAVNRDWLLKKNILFRQGIVYEDCLFVFQCLMAAEKVMHRNFPLLIYRVREGSTMTSKPGYKNVKSRMVCYMEILGFMLQHELPDRIAEAVAKFAEMVMRHLKELDFQMSMQERQSPILLSPAERVLMAGLEIGIYNTKNTGARMLFLGFWERVKESGAIVIYGAGKIGRMVYHFLKKNGLSGKVSAFAVTGSAGTGEIEGVPVREIGDSVLPRDALLLVAANAGFQSDMLQAAYRNGFHNLEVINRNLEWKLDGG